MNFIRDIGALIAVAAVCAGVVYAFMEFRAPGLISAELDSRGLYTEVEATNLSDKIAAIEKDVDDQKATHNSDRDRMDSKIERIVDILLEE